MYNNEQDCHLLARDISYRSRRTDVKISKKKSIAFFAILFLTTTLVIIQTNAFTVVFPGIHSRYYYAVKFICNIGQDPNEALQIGLAPGFYYTDINVHNPSYSITSANIEKKFVVATPEDPNQGITQPQIIQADPTPYALREVILRPDAAMRIDCNDILAVLHSKSPAAPPMTTAKGFVMIYSQIPIAFLDVFAEYSTQATATCPPTILGFECSAPPSIEVVQIFPSNFKS